MKAALFSYKVLSFATRERQEPGVFVFDELDEPA
jgi:hypothetical protein